MTTPGFDESVLDVLEDCAFIQLDCQGTISGWSRGAELLFGYAAHEAMGESLALVLQSEPSAAVTSQEQVRALLAGAVARGGAFHSGYCRTKSGTPVWVDTSLYPRRDAAGNVMGFVYSARVANARLGAHEAPGGSGSLPGVREEHLRIAFEAAVDAVFVTDENGTILQLNPSAECTFGYSRQEAIGQNIRLIMPPEHAAHHDGYLGRFSAAQRSTVVGTVREIHGMRRDGSCFPVELTLSMGTLDGRRVYVGNVRDISDRRAAERERDRFKSLIETTTDFVSMSDPQGNLIYQNPAANAMIGWGPDAHLTGKRIPDAHPPEVARRIVEQCLPIVLRDGAYEFESTLLHVDGTEIPVSQVAMAHRNAAGELEYFSTVMRDLRKQQRAESLLAKIASQVQGVLFQLELRPDGSARFPYASVGAYEMLGRTPEELAVSAAVLADSIFPADFEMVSRGMRESAAALQPWAVEYRFRIEDGSVRWHRCQAVPERANDGSTLWHGFITDITELRRATDEARNAKLELEQAIGVLDAGFAMYDADERLVVCNERYAQLYKLSSELRFRLPKYEEVVRECFTKYPEFHDYLPAGVDLETWLRHRLAEFRDPKGPVMQRVGGRWIRVEEYRTLSGGIVCMRTDVTALKQAEFEARAQEQRFKLATTTAGIGVWELEPKSGAITWNERMFQLYGFEPGAFQAQYADWRSRIHPEEREATEAAFRAAIEEGRDFSVRLRLQLPDGAVRYLDSHCTYTRAADGQITLVHGVSLDVTDQVEHASRLQQLVEKAEAATKAKAEFLATMSHEIRTPMNGVIGMTNLLMQTSMTAEQREYAETIRSSGETLLTLVNDILDFSKIEAGKLVLENAPFSLEQVAMETIMLFATTAESKGVRLLHDMPPAPTFLVGDSTRIRQILLNLISNALKFTKRGHVKVTMGLARASLSKVDVRICVSDTGIGMSSEHLARLGEAFLQADASTTRQFGGTGLGLSICKSLVHLMKGQLKVTSELGHGTQFEVLLPMDLATAADIAGSVASVSLPVVRKLRRVLVAEDNLVNQRVVSLMLKNFVEEVVLAKDGCEAVEKFKHSVFDCVLMDGHMPEMDGMEASRQIRAYEAQSGRGRTPIIALTANALPGDREAYLEAGMDEYLTKPVRTNDLAAALSRVGARRGAPN